MEANVSKVFDELGVHVEGKDIQSLCVYYCGLWNKCKKLKVMGKLNVFFVSNGIIKVKILENDPAKPVAADLKSLMQLI